MGGRIVTPVGAAEGELIYRHLDVAGAGAGAGYLRSRPAPPARLPSRRTVGVSWRRRRPRRLKTRVSRRCREGSK